MTQTEFYEWAEETQQKRSECESGKKYRVEFIYEIEQESSDFDTLQMRKSLPKTSYENKLKILIGNLR